MGRRRMPSDDRGATGVEYALIAGLIAVVALVGISFVGRSLSGSLEDSASAIGAAVGATSTSTATATQTPTATPSSTASATASSTASPSSSASASTGPVVVSVTGGGDSVADPTPTYNSERSRWECPSGWQVTGSGTGRRCQETGRS